MSEPVVQRQAVPDPQEALREQIAQAVGPLLHAVTCRIAGEHSWQACSMWPAPSASTLVADAVLPVVQAHTQALRDMVRAEMAEEAKYRKSPDEQTRVEIRKVLRELDDPGDPRAAD